MTNDPDYVGGVGVGGMGRDLNHMNDSGTPGGPGRVVVRLVP
jgi:hypothetical protein